MLVSLIPPSPRPVHIAGSKIPYDSDYFNLEYKTDAIRLYLKYKQGFENCAQA